MSSQPFQGAPTELRHEFSMVTGLWILRSRRAVMTMGADEVEVHGGSEIRTREVNLI